MSNYKYSTFEDELNRKRIRGGVLRTLEFDKIIAALNEKASTVYGRELCAGLCPITDFDTVASTLKETEEVYTYVNKYGPLPLNGFPDIRGSLSYGKAGGTMTMRQLLDAAVFLRSCEYIKGIVSNEKADMADSELFGTIKAIVAIPKLEKDISSSIDNEDEMNDRASDTLYRIRVEKKDLANTIRTLLDRVIRNHEDILQENIITIRGDRYCVPVRAEFKNRINGIVHDTSSTGQTVFIEPMAVVEANNRIRELASLEKIEIERILEDLTDRVMACSDSLHANISLVAKLDFNSAKANLAYEMEAVVPSLNTEGKVRLKGARHPLIDKDKVVPVDIEIGYDYETLVITGPNTGGKTVSLKTCGLLTLMVMAGLMVPAKTGSEMAVFDRVLADIGDEQSIEQSLSTFSAHMSNVVFILKNIRGRSLILLDELGSGTDPAEGAALAISILDSMRAKGAVTMATTHYKELKAYAIGTEGVMNAACEFDTNTLAPTYKLIIGRPGSSNAFIISKKLGLPADIIDSAISNLSMEEMNFERLLESAEKNNREAVELKEENLKLKKELSEKIADLDKEKAALKSSKTKILNDSRARQKELLEDKAEELEELIKSLRKESAQKSKDDMISEMEKIRKRLRAGAKDLTDDSEDDLIMNTVSLPGEAPKEVKAGETYFVPHLNLMGTAIDTPGKSGKVRIQAGAINVSVKRDQLRLPTKAQLDEMKPQEKAKKNLSDIHDENKNKRGKSVSELKFDRSLSTSSEIMLIGKTVDEAESLLNSYLDSCQLAGIREIRIVHGKGTGALRSALQSMLASDIRVDSYRNGIIGEGDDGVTIAKLR